MEDYLKTLLGITPSRSSVNPNVGMFGMSPYEAEQAAYSDDAAFADRLAKASLAEKETMGLGRAGAGLGRMVGGMMGMVDPRVEQAKQQQSIQAQIDHNSVEGLMKGAQLFNAAGNPRMAFMYTQAAQAQKAKQQAAFMEARKQDLAEQKQDELETFRREQMKEANELKVREMEQRYELAKERAADSRLAAADRVAAQREATQMRLMIAQMMAQSKSSASEQKITETEKRKNEGRGTVENLTSGLRDYYNQLNEMGSITNPEKGAVSNLAAGTASSAAGQAVGRMFGTKSQSLRNSIAQQRPLLLQAIKEATGMTAKQMDSNTELKLYLSVATDPTLDVKANLDALNKIEELYGLGGKGVQSAPKEGVQLPSASAIDAELARRSKK